MGTKLRGLRHTHLHAHRRGHPHASGHSVLTEHEHEHHHSSEYAQTTEGRPTHAPHSHNLQQESELRRQQLSGR